MNPDRTEIQGKEIGSRWVKLEKKKHSSLNEHTSGDSMP